MDLALLESFVTIAEELHFSRAATRRHLTQPAISKQLQQLEYALGVDLFARTRRAVLLTAHGAELLPWARATLAAAARLREVASQLKRGEAGRLRLAFSPTAPQQVLPKLVESYRTRFPRVSLELRELSSQQQLQALLQHEVDVGIARHEASQLPRGVKFMPLITERLVVAVPREWSLASKKRLRLSALNAVPWVLVQRDASPLIWDVILAACVQAGFSPKLLQTGTQLHSTLALVAAGLGVSVVPDSARLFGTRSVCFVPLQERLVSTLGLISLEASRNPVAQHFLETAKVETL